VQQGQLFGYLDEEGNTLTDIRYPQADSFLTDVARVLAPDGQPGYINANGQEFWD